MALSCTACVTSVLASQPSEPGSVSGLPPEPAYIHRTWQFEDGLPHNTVQTVVQTGDGYLWVGTADGLARFDGARFTIYTPENTPGLKSRQIRKLLETRDGALWMATDEGLTRLQDGEFSHFSTDDGLAGNLVRELFQMEDGSLWIGTITGLSIFRGGEFHNPDVPEMRSVIRGIGQRPGGEPWVADQRNLLNWVDGAITSWGRDGAERRAPVNMFTAIAFDQSGTLWAGSMYGVVRMRDGKFTAFGRKHGLSDLVVHAVLEDSGGVLWIGTSAGLNRFSGGHFMEDFDAQGHSYDLVRAITEDREGNIWIGSRDGLTQLRPRLFSTFTILDGLGHNNIMSVMEDRAGALWIGTWGGGLDRMEGGRVTFSLNREQSLETQPQSYMHSDFALAAYETRDRGIWFGLDYDGGLYQFHHGTLTRYGEIEGVAPSAVRAIYEDRTGNLWVGSRTALHLFRDGKFTQFTTADGLPDNLVRVFCEDEEGNLWMGTEKGLVRYAGGEFHLLTTAEGLVNDFIMSLYCDPAGNLWIGTEGGLMRYRDSRFSHYTKNDGLFADGVLEIVEDDFGYLWMSTRIGIFRVAKRDLDAFDRGEIERIPSVAYGRENGILSIQCNAAAKPSGVKSRDGRIWFATTKGVVVVDPRAVAQRRDSPPPTVRIEHVVLGKRVEDARHVSNTKVRERQVEFHFTALSLTVPERNKFSYKLEGFDDEWIDAGARRVAYYTNLRPGRYVFRLKGSNHEGLWNEEGAAVTFTVVPRFYETGWFFLGCMVAGGSSIFGGYRIRLRRLHRRKTELEGMVAERTQTLRSEIAERKRIQSQIDNVHKQLLIASHKAGMAEVASGVLHNVGNVLNSVNVSANLIAERIRRPRADNLGRAAAMVEKNAHRLPEFLTTDEAGRQLPAYLTALSDYLSQEQEEMQKELAGLTRNIDHIKDIVAMQQSYAKLSGLVETLPVTDLVEDALQMNDAALARHGVVVVREYLAEPIVTVDRHRVLQILVNLIRNAKYACTDSGLPEKRLILRVDLPSPERVQICVSDNGVGIPPENMTLIFSHGFTSRANGHGFGLHSGALAASAIGGSISAYSEGAGRGAAFTLEFPLAPASQP